MRLKEKTQTKIQHKIADVKIESLQASGVEISCHKDYSLELSSSGLGRCLPSRREFQIFRGQPVRCLENSCWHNGVLLGLTHYDTGNLELSLAIATSIRVFSLEQLLKV